MQSEATIRLFSLLCRRAPYIYLAHVSNSPWLSTELFAMAWTISDVEDSDLAECAMINRRSFIDSDSQLGLFPSLASMLRADVGLQ